MDVFSLVSFYFLASIAFSSKHFFPPKKSISLTDLDREGSAGGGQGNKANSRRQRARPNFDDSDNRGPYQSSQPQEIGEM